MKGTITGIERMFPQGKHMVHAICLIMGVLVVSCQTPELLGKEDLQQFIRDEANGLSASTTSGSTGITVSYRPNDLMVLHEIDGGESVEAIMDRYKDYMYFDLSMKAGKRDVLYGTSSTQADFNEKLQTLSFRMDQFVELVTSNQDTIPVADFYYARTFGLSKNTHLLFAFRKDKITKAEAVAFRMREFGFETGNQTFRFDTKKLMDAPKLKELQPYHARPKN